MESDEEEVKKTFIQSASKFGAKALPVKEPKALDEDQVKKATAILL